MALLQKDELNPEGQGFQRTSVDDCLYYLFGNNEQQHLSLRLKFHGVVCNIDSSEYYKQKLSKSHNRKTGGEKSKLVFFQRH